jgi:hypothetical protein
MPVHPDAAAVKQHRPVRAVCDRPVDGTADGWRQRNQHDLGTFAAHAKHPVAVLLAQVGDVRAGVLEDSQLEQAEHGHQREVARWLARLTRRITVCYFRASRSSRQACSQRRQASAQTWQCGMWACRSHSSPQLLQIATQACSSGLVTSAS